MGRNTVDEVDEGHKKKVPLGITFLGLLGFPGPKTRKSKLNMYRFFILVLTFLTYTNYHMSRRPITVAKTQIVKCSNEDNSTTVSTTNGTTTWTTSISTSTLSTTLTTSSSHSSNPTTQTTTTSVKISNTTTTVSTTSTTKSSTTAKTSTTDPNKITSKVNLQLREEDKEICSSWISQIDGKEKDEADTLLGSLDTTYLLSYAIFMFPSGMIADRLDLRYFLAGGMIGSGIITILFGVGKYLNIHSLIYFIFIQFLCGIFEATGWPGVVAVVGNWFGHAKKGLIMGIWNSHTSVGNIVGASISGAFVDTDWGLSFVVPGIIIIVFGIIMWLFLVPRPEDVDLELESIDVLDETRLLDSNNSVRSRSQSISTLSITPYPIEDEAISFLGALKIPGVIEFSISLFFAKLVAYTFLYWLPTFIQETGINVTSQNAADISIYFDVGGIIGGILAGLAADFTGMSASVCSIMLIIAVPTLFSYKQFNSTCPLNMSTSACYGGNIFLIIVNGILVNGPYALITTAVSADLGTHPSLKGSSKALATVTAIIDGTGSIGAAVGPFLAGAIPGKDTSHQLDNTFYMLMAANVISLFLLTRLVIRETKRKLPFLWKQEVYRGN